VIEGVPVVFSAVQVLQCDDADLLSSGAAFSTEDAGQFDDDPQGQD